MTKRSTTSLGTSSKETVQKRESEKTDGTTSSESCPVDWAKMRYARSLRRFGPQMKSLFKQVRLALRKYESEVVKGLSGATSLNDYDELVMARYRTCETLLGEIELRLSLLSHQAQHPDLYSDESKQEEVLLNAQRQDFQSDLH